MPEEWNMQTPEITEDRAERTTVLFAGNDESHVRSIAALLRKDECLEWIGWTRTLQQTIEACLARQPGIIILDERWNEPGKDIVAKKLYALRPDLKILLIAYEFEYEEIFRSLSTGNTNQFDCVVKPFDESELLHALHALRDMRPTFALEGAQRLSILVVDDEEPIRDIIASIVLAAGFHMRQAASGREAVELCTAHRPDIILMDLMMAELDGIAAADIIFKLYPGIRIILVTAVHDASVCLACLKLPNIYGYLLKPFERPHLVHLIRSTNARRVKHLCPNLLGNTKLQLIDSQEANFNLSLLGFLVHDLRNEIALMGWAVQSLNRHAGRDLNDRPQFISILTTHLRYADHILAAVRDIAEIESVRSGNRNTRDAVDRLFGAIRYCVNEIRIELDKSAANVSGADEAFAALRRGIEHTERLLNATLEMHRATVVVDDLFRETSSISTPRVHSGIQLRFEHAAQPIKLFTDFSRIVNILVQLIDNSVKALEGREGFISVTAMQQRKAVRLAVRDNGAGIPEKIKKQLLKLPVESTTGSGMGLYLSNRIVNELGGTMTVLSGNDGTEVSITLPNGE